MRTLRYVDEDSDLIPDEYLSDCEILQEQLLEQNYRVSLYDIYKAWKEYSDGMAASWIILYDNTEENIDRILNYLK